MRLLWEARMLLTLLPLCTSTPGAVAPTFQTRARLTVAAGAAAAAALAAADSHALGACRAARAVGTYVCGVTA
jgi:hypothetical protein